MKSIHFCICLALTGFLIILSCPGASASAAVDPRRKPTIDAKQDLLNPPVDHPIEKYQVTVWVNVPHNKNGKESLRAVPYLIELPKARNGYSAITEEYSDLKSSLYSLGFANRQNRGLHLYNGRGWRFTYAMDSAVRESGLGYPNTLFEANSWCEEIYPYLKKYIVRSNEAENARSSRYRQANTDYEEKHAEIEYEALKKGFFPIDLTVMPYHLSVRRAQVQLPEGSWWITGSHKVVGITYYWQEPIQVGAGQANSVELTEANAILIDGGAW